MRFHDVPASLALLLLAPQVAHSFYLPGFSPTTFKKGDLVALNVNHLTPAESNVDHTTHSIFSFDYYHNNLKFCRPEKVVDQSESLGSILFGDRIQNSAYILKMAQNQTQCMASCAPAVFSARDAKFTNSRIWQSYNVNWYIDGLPAATPFIDTDTETRFYQPGFPLGTADEQQVALHNHYDIFVSYHEVRREEYRVVGVQVVPMSLGDSKLINPGTSDLTADCEDTGRPMILSEEQDAQTNVTWTYRVYWEPSPTTFATRWDKYLHVFAPRIHWFSLVNSAVIVTFLIGTVSTVLSRTLRKDIARYNRLEQFELDDVNGDSAEDGIQEDSGWKLVHGDVFRPPKHSLILAVFVGNGAQLFSMVGTTIAIAAVGFLSPSNRGALGTIMILLYTVFGFVGGYVSSRVYKTFKGEKWKQLFIYTPLLVPGTVFITFFLLNLFVWARQSSGAVPFTTMLAIVAIWFVISLPLSIAGSWLGFKQSHAEPPVKTNQIPRQIPPASGYLRPIPSMLLVGMLPFFAIFVELYFIMSSLWSSRIYYMFGFLFLCFGLMIITSAAATIILVYFVLCIENYHWQWRSFAASGASAAYVFVASLLYWAKSISFSTWTGGFLFLGYSLLVSFLWFVLTGSIGYVASAVFVHRIYGSLKID